MYYPAGSRAAWTGRLQAGVRLMPIVGKGGAELEGVLGQPPVDTPTYTRQVMFWFWFR